MDNTHTFLSKGSRRGGEKTRDARFSHKPGLVLDLSFLNIEQFTLLLTSYLVVTFEVNESLSVTSTALELLRFF